MANMIEILNETTALMQRKSASFNGSKKAIAGENPDSMPGSEHDAPIPEGSTSPNPEVADKTMGPASARKTEGAGDDSPVTRGHALDAEEGEQPTKKPAITDDANAKTAKCAKIANDMLADIRKFQKSAEVVADKPVPPFMKKKDEGKKPAVPAEKKETPAEEAKEEKAAATGMELTGDLLQKIAAICLSTEEGTNFVAEQLEKYAGAKSAEEILGFVAAQADEQEKLAAEAAGYADGMKMINQRIFDAGKAEGSKVAAVKPAAPKAVEKKATPVAPKTLTIAQLLKLGQAMADAGIGDVMGALPGPDGAPVGAPVGEPAPAEGGVEAGAGGEEFTPDDLASALDVLVSQGEIQPQEAQEIMQAVMTGPESSETPVGADAEPDGAPVPEGASEGPAEEKEEAAEPKAEEAAEKGAKEKK